MTAIKQNQERSKPGMLIAIKNWLSTMNVSLFFLLVFIYHILVTFQGLDFNDEGFHLAFYQQIFSDPNSVQYAFWGWLTGIVGGLFMKLFPFLGMWGIRLLGAFVSTCTIIIAFNLLKKYLDKVYLMVSLVMLSLYINEDAKNLYYNNLSAFLYFVSAYFLFLGLKENKKWMLILSGLVVGCNVFTRIPNVLGISLILAIFYCGYLWKKRMKEIVMGAALFMGGVLVAFLTIFIVMKLLGHLDFFIGSIKMVLSPSRGEKDDGLNGAYGFSRLLTSNLRDYIRSLRFSVSIGVLALLIGFVNYAVRNSIGAGRKILPALNSFFFLGALGLVVAGWFISYRLMEFFVGMSILSAILLFDKKLGSEIKLLTFIGGLITLIHPFGSSEGIGTVVIYSMWLSFPIAMDYIFRLNWINLDLNVKTGKGNISFHGLLTSQVMRWLKWGTVGIISLASLYNVIRYPYLCDRHERWDMKYSVDNKFMMGVFTSKSRASALNELEQASSKFAKPGDIVLAYDCMPMYHFMTQTRSYVRNPCIWFYTTDMFRRELNLAETTQNKLPVIVRQLIKTTGEGGAWPDKRPATNYLQFKRNQGKNNILDEFIKRHGYSEAWNNGLFVILVPQNK